MASGAMILGATGALMGGILGAATGGFMFPRKKETVPLVAAATLAGALSGAAVGGVAGGVFGAGFGAAGHTRKKTASAFFDEMLKIAIAKKVHDCGIEDANVRDSCARGCFHYDYEFIGRCATTVDYKSIESEIAPRNLEESNAL